MNKLSAGKYWGLRRMADDAGHFIMLAVDQRPPIAQLCAQKRHEASARFEDMRRVKRVMMEALAPHASAVLADPTYALTDALRILSPQHGLIVTLEDSQFAETEGGRMSKPIDDWSVHKIRKTGADAVKVLTWYRPDQSEATRNHQKDFTKRIGEACAEHDIPFLLELLVYPLAGEAHQTKDYVEQQGKRADHVIRSVDEFSGADFGVDVFKLESPIAAADVPGPNDDPEKVRQCAGYFHELGKAAGRPWVMLSAGATKAAFSNVMHYAFEAGASGFLAGRAIWWEDFQRFPDIDAMRAGMARNAVPYLGQLAATTAARATAWHAHPVYQGDPGPAGSDETDFARWYT